MRRFLLVCATSLMVVIFLLTPVWVLLFLWA